MILRFSTLALSIFLMVLGWTLFHVKYTVVDLENAHRSLRKSILSKSEELHVLNAEWTFLNNPERLKDLAKRHLKLEPIRGEQRVSYSDVQNSGLGEYDRKGLQDVLQNPPKGSQWRGEQP